MLIYGCMESTLSPLSPLRDVVPLTSSILVLSVHCMSTWGLTPNPDICYIESIGQKVYV